MAFFLILGALVLTLNNASATEQVRSERKISDNARLRHVKELLGHRHYKKLIKVADRYADVNHYIYQVTKKSLAPQWRKLSKRITQTILQEAKRYRFDPVFLVSVIQTESEFNPSARGDAGEIGLMQLMPETAKWIAGEFDLKWRGKKALFNPITNIRFGAAYLSLLREKFGSDGRLYLPAYNMGPTAVRHALDREVIPIDYAKRVMKKYLNNYSEIHDSASAERPLKARSTFFLGTRRDGVRDSS